MDESRPAPKDAPVPTPTVSQLPAKEEPSTRRSEGQNWTRWIETCRKRAHLWQRETPSFTMPDIDLAHFEQQPKNRKKDVKLAEMKMREMESQTADACSGRWYDKSGRLMVAVFADHILTVSLALQLLYSSSKS